MNNSHTIQSHHLKRQAIIYIRQSTLAQVRDNRASTERQYALSERAQTLGWSETMIRIIDQDLGQSGSTSHNRDGFQALVTEVSLQQVGAVFALEASRLARSSSDWYRLLEICALTDTLVIDEDGIYDPGQYNDRILLGFKGTMSEAELHWLHQRLRGGSLNQAKQGKLRFQLPVGLVHLPNGEITFDPNEDVQAAIRLVFDLFARYKKATPVVRHFYNHQLLFPKRYWGGVRDGEITWGPLGYNRVLSILHNPFYAGAYVYGKTKSQTKSLPDTPRRLRESTKRLQRSEWTVLIRDHHVAYVSWEQFLQNEASLDANRYNYSTHRKGAAREGSALLQGIAICGFCGKRLNARYRPDGLPMYECPAERASGGKTCQSLKGDHLDQAVTQCLFDALKPAELLIALETFSQFEKEAQQVETQRQRQLERAQYEADLVKRRYFAVDPDNRLVARTLEEDWNNKLSNLETLQQEYASRARLQPHPLTSQERDLILSLNHALPLIWQADSTTHEQRKQLLRLLISDVVIRRHETGIDLGIRWQTNAISQLTIPRLPSSADLFQTDPRVVGRIRELAPFHSDLQIVQILNAEGFQSGRGGDFNKCKLKWLRRQYNIPCGCLERPVRGNLEPRGDGRYPSSTVAQMLNVSKCTVTKWCRTGVLDSVRANRHSPYWIAISLEQIQTLRKS